MANIVITVDTSLKKYKVNSNAVNTSPDGVSGGWDEMFIHMQDIDYVHKNGSVVVHFNGVMHDWEITHDGANSTWEVDSIRGTTITTLDELFTEMDELRDGEGLTL